MRGRDVFEDDTGISPVIGVVLLIAISVIMVSLIGSIIISQGGFFQPIPHTDIVYNQEGSNVTLAIASLTGASTIDGNQIDILVDGNKACDTWDNSDEIGLGDTTNISGYGAGCTTLEETNTISVVWSGGQRAKLISSYDIRGLDDGTGDTGDTDDGTGDTGDTDDGTGDTGDTDDGPTEEVTFERLMATAPEMGPGDSDGPVDIEYELSGPISEEKVNIYAEYEGSGSRVTKEITNSGETITLSPEPQNHNDVLTIVGKIGGNVECEENNIDVNGGKIDVCSS